jgi:hypothetical protein
MPNGTSMRAVPRRKSLFLGRVIDVSPYLSMVASLMEVPFYSMPISLPPLSTEAGAVAHMLVNECNPPGIPHDPHYNEAETLRAMRLMKVVLDNRLNHRPPASSGYLPSMFGAPNATTLADVIIGGQIAGFSRSGGAIHVAPAVMAHINAIVNEANHGLPGAYFRHVQHAIDVANAPVVADEFASLSTVGGVSVLGRTYGWRPHGSPGSNFVAIPNGLIQGNQFYTLLPHPAG